MVFFAILFKVVFIVPPVESRHARDLNGNSDNEMLNTAVLNKISLDRISPKCITIKMVDSSLRDIYDLQKERIISFRDVIHIYKSISAI